MRLKYIGIALPLVALAVLSMGTLTGIALTPDQQVWRLMREVTVDDTALTTTTNTWTNVESSAVFVPVRRGWTWVQVAAIGYGDGTGAGDPSAGTFNYRILAVRKGCGAQIVCTGAMAVGGLRLSHAPYGAVAVLSDPTSYLFVEGPASCTDYWSTGSSADGTTDDIGTVSFATNGIFGFGVEVTAMTGVTSVILIYTGGP
jgi:hypothetical protein